MNKIYIDQITRYMNSARLKFQNHYDDMAMAHGSLEWFVEYLSKQLGNCQGVYDGRSEFHSKHEDCSRLLDILFDLTGDEKYINKKSPAPNWD